MAQNKKEQNNCDFNAELKRLKSSGPEGLYLLYGPEDYLRDHFLTALRDICVPDGESSFNFRRMNGPGLDYSSLSNAMDAMPFLADRTFIELHAVDINKLPEAEKFIRLMDSIPEYCTLVFVQDAAYEPDGRLKCVKFLKEKGRALCFSGQDQSALVNWVVRRFKALGKEIDRDTAERLILISGDLMNRLIPEIEKIAAYAKTDHVLRSDVEAVASHIPEADIFEMVNSISEKRFDNAVKILSELLKNKDNSPYAILALVSSQLRRLYGVKLLLEKGKHSRDIRDALKIRFDFIVDKLIASAGKFTFEQLTDGIEGCVEAEYRMKTSSVDESEVLKEVLISLITGDSYA